MASKFTFNFTDATDSGWIVKNLYFESLNSVNSIKLSDSNGCIVTFSDETMVLEKGDKIEIDPIIHPECDDPSM